jgi:hypothetical protein
MVKLRLTVRHPGERMLLTGRHLAIWGNLDSVEHQLSSVQVGLCILTWFKLQSGNDGREIPDGAYA